MADRREPRVGQVWEHPATGNRLTITSVGPLKVDGVLSHRDFPGESDFQGLPFFLVVDRLMLIHDPEEPGDT